MDDRLTTEVAETDGSEAVTAFAAPARAPVGGRKVFVRTFGCQMNVYDSERMAEALARARLWRDGRHRGRRPHHPQHLPHPREGRRKGLFRARPHPRHQGRARRSRPATPSIAVAGCVAQAEGDEIVRRAPVVDLVVGPQSYHRLPELIAQRRAGAKRRWSRPSSPRTTSSATCRATRDRPAVTRPLGARSSPCRKAATSSARSASCPTRAARSIRAASPTSSDEARASRRAAACARSRCSARTSTPITAPGADGRAVLAGRSDPPSRRASTASSGCATRPAIPAT